MAFRTGPFSYNPPSGYAPNDILDENGIPIIDQTTATLTET